MSVTLLSQKFSKYLVNLATNTECRPAVYLSVTLIILRCHEAAVWDLLLFVGHDLYCLNQRAYVFRCSVGSYLDGSGNDVRLGKGTPKA